MQIDERDWLDENGKTYEWASDRFIQYSLVELCGSDHLKYEPIFLYFYDQFTNPIRNFDLIRPDKLKSQMITPYQPL